MDSAKKLRTSIFFITFLIILLLLTGIGFHQWQKNRHPLAEDSLPQTEEISVNQPSETGSQDSEEPIILENTADPALVETEESGTTEAAAVTEEETATEKETDASGKPGSYPGHSEIYIPLTKSLFGSSSVSIESFQSRKIQADNPAVFGKMYYRSENGKLESVLSLDAEGNLHELLQSFDALGNPVDNLEIGVLSPESGRRKYATLSVNKLSVFEQVAASSGKKEEWVTEYFILPQMQFHKGKTFSKLP